MLEGQPQAEFVEIGVRLIFIQFVASSEDSSSDNASSTNKRRAWLSDSTKFVKDVSPAIEART